VGLQLVEKADPQPAVPDVDTILENCLDLLAEEEHRGWMDVKLNNGWTKAPPPKDKAELDAQHAARLHHGLVPYAELSDEDKHKDCDSVRNFPAVAALAGFKIVARMPSAP
jgi:hypothetical protein